jgi:hypothetical protein
MESFKTSRNLNRTKSICKYFVGALFWIQSTDQDKPCASSQVKVQYGKVYGYASDYIPGQEDKVLIS